MGAGISRAVQFSVITVPSPPFVDVARLGGMSDPGGVLVKFSDELLNAHQAQAVDCVN